MRNIKVERTGGYNHALDNESNNGLTVVFMGNNEFRAKNSSTIFLKKNTTLKSYNGDTEIATRHGRPHGRPICSKTARS